MVFAGVWQGWGQGSDALTTCAIVTTAANEDMASIHHRLPVILDPDHWPLWLGEEGKGAATVMKSAPEGALDFRRVSTEVNSNRAKGAKLIAALSD